LRARAQEIVKNIADQFGGKLTPWHNSVAPEWEYAKLTIGEIGFTVGASTGGVVSVTLPFWACARHHSTGKLAHASICSSKGPRLDL